MAGIDCGSYWIVWTAGVDEPTQVEQVATFEQAYARWQALEEAAAFSAEVFGRDGLVLLNRDLWYAPRWAMTAPMQAGRWQWVDEERGFERLAA